MIDIGIAFLVFRVSLDDEETAMRKKYIVKLSQQQRLRLEKLVRSGVAPASLQLVKSPGHASCSRPIRESTLRGSL